MDDWLESVDDLLDNPTQTAGGIGYGTDDPDLCWKCQKVPEATTTGLCEQCRLILLDENTTETGDLVSTTKLAVDVYFDTTRGYPVFWNGCVWVDATGTPAFSLAHEGLGAFAYHPAQLVMSHQIGVVARHGVFTSSPFARRHILERYRTGRPVFIPLLVYVSVYARWRRWRDGRVGS